MKKLLTLILAVCMTVTLCSGIGVAASAETLKEGNFAGYPIPEGGTLTMWTSGLAYHSDYMSEEESPYHQFLEEFTGVDIIWKRPAAGADASQAYNLMIATGELPDIIFKDGLNNEVETMLDDGVFLPIDSYMADYAPALSAVLAADPATEKAIRSDSGVLYAFPFLREDVNWLGSWLGASINTQFLDACGLDMPVTVADWEETLTAFKNLEECDIPLTFYSASHVRAMFGNAFGFNGVDNYYIDKDGNAATWMNADGYYDFLVTMHRWYEQGLIDPDFITMDLTAFVTKFVAEKVGASMHGSATPARYNLLVEERDGGWFYDAAPYAVANEGDEILFAQGEALWTGVGAVITTACENVELAMRFLDYGYTEEGIMAWNYGKEGVSYYYDDNGVPHMNDEILNAEEGATLALSRYTALTANGITIMSVDWNRGKQLPIAVAMVDNWVLNTENAPAHRWPPVCATIDESTELSNIENAITTYANEMYLNFITGAEELTEESYAAYLANLDSMNIARVLEIKGEQLARYNAR